MAQGLITNTYLEDIADAIRFKSGGSDTYTPANMADAINNIPTGASEVVVFLDGMSLYQNDVTGLLGDKDPSTLAKVYCNNISSINGTSYDNSVLEKDVAWTAVTNGYYNAQYNTYIYNNYLPVQRDSSLYAKFQGNSSFNLAVRTSRAVTNMAYMMNGCSTFDNSVQIGNSVTNCRSIVMDCTNFNQPLHFPNSVVNARSALWGCTNFNSPVIFDEGMHDLDLRGLFADTSFNLPFTIPNGTINVGVMFQNALFNQPIVIPNSVNAPEGLAYFLFNATSFNQPITIGRNITNCLMAFDCPSGNGSFNQNIYFPYNVSQYNYALYGQSNFESNIYINNRLADASNFYWFVGDMDNSKRKNIFCYNLSVLNRKSSPTLIGDNAITWTAINSGYDGYYNSYYNIYLYNNYLGKQGGTSLTSMISLVDKSNFNLPVSMEDTVTNCYNMLANCFNFNSPVEFSNNLQNGQRAMRFCNNFNLPITVPASLTDTYQMFGYCTRLNSPITLTHGLTTMYGMFRHCDSLNQPLNIPNTVTNCYDAISYTAMNCDVYIPASVTDCVYMMSGTNVFEANIYINGTPNCKGLLEDRNYTTRVNIFCNDLSILTGTTPSDSITDLAMTWTEMTNGYYNSQYNIYLYNNYEGG